MSGEEGPVSISISSLSRINGEEGPVSLSVSSLSWISGEEGHIYRLVFPLALDEWRWNADRKL